MANIYWVVPPPFGTSASTARHNFKSMELKEKAVATDNSPSEKKQWFIHSNGTTFGPLLTDVVRVLLRQRRVNSTEFIWTRGMDRWVRILDQQEFIDVVELPPYPEAPVPSEDPDVEIVKEEAPPMQESAPNNLPDERETPSEVPKQPLRLIRTPPAHSFPPLDDGSSQKTEDPRPAPRQASAQPAIKLEELPYRSELRHSQRARARQSLPIEELERKIRYAPRVPIEGTVATENYGTLKLVDVSETGVLFENRNPLKPGTQLAFSLESGELPKSPFKMTGVVTRNVTVNGASHTAVEFTRINPAYKRILKDFVTEKMNKQ